MRIGQMTNSCSCFEEPLWESSFSVFDRALLDSLSVGIIFVDDTGVVSYLNNTAEVLLEVDRYMVIGKRVDMLPLRAPIYRFLSENGSLPVELSLNGKTIVKRSSQVVLKDGTIVGEVSELIDITIEKKEAKAREEFVAMMTHDLKSPLQVVAGYAQMIRQGIYGKLSESLDSSVENIEKAAQRLTAMIEDVLDSYRLEGGGLRINRKFGDVKPVLAWCCQEKLQEAKIQGISFQYVIEDDLPHIKFDDKQIARVFANLLGNAVKFTPRSGRVVLTSAVREGNINVVVEDTGIGIPTHDLPRIFNKFYRSHGASGFKGTGLGLAISKAIVEAHGGSIQVESDEGRGSRFVVTIPCSDEARCS